MPRTFLFILLLLSSLCIENSLTWAFAGGFGKSTSGNKRTKKRNKGGRALDQDILPTLSPPSSVSPSPHKEESPSPPALDKWGLPPPSEEDIFPPLPPDTELIPVSKDKYSLTEILDATAHTMDLPGLALHFDEYGVEKAPLSNTPPVKLKLVHQSPPVLVLDNFLTQQECGNVQRVALPDDDDDDDTPPPSTTSSTPVQVDSATFSTLSFSKRTSTSWFCPYEAVPTVLAKVQHLLGVPVQHMEEPQIVRYQTGQEFSFHYDEVPTAQLSNGGQRVGTFLIYLNTLSAHHSGGGGTVFRDLVNQDGTPLTIQPQQGRVCLFFPADKDGKPDERTLHKGEKVVTENQEKRIIQIWFHQREYRATLPPNNLQEHAAEGIQRESQRLGYL